MRGKISTYLENLTLILLGFLLFIFPLALTTVTTDVLALPKQILLVGGSILLFVLLGLRFVMDKIVRIRRTPLDLPVFIFLVSVFLGSVLSINKTESIVAFVPLFFSGTLYFLITNTAKTKKAVLFLAGAFIKGAAVASLLFVLTFFKIYILPLSFTHDQLFSIIGSLLDQAVYLTTALVLGLFLAYSFRKTGKEGLRKLKAFPVLAAVFGLEAIILTLGAALTIYALVKLQRPVILPFSTGFQVGFASISQDASRALLSFLFGSGFGTFAVDFSRFKQAVFNQNQALWTLTFFRSSSFVLELLATTGIVGLLSFIFLSYKVLRQKPLFVPLAFFLLLTLLLPISPITQILLFVLLGIFAGLQSLTHKGYFDVELALVTLKNGLLAVVPGNEREVRSGLSRILPAIVFFIILLAGGLLGLMLARYTLANTTFQESLVAASQNKGSDSYTKQSQALALVNYNDAYYRVFSQTNLALANSLSNSIPKGSSPSAQTTQTIYTLIQQSINSARSATTLSPMSVINWQNLSSVYRNLIGFGQNADSFAVLANQQAIALDPSNPQEYLNLGGLYYQLQLWDKAAEQFRIAISLKPDFANAYYNLAHALEQKNDIKGALDVLDQVKTLVKNDPANLKKVQEEIDALKKGQPAKTQQNPTLPLPPQATPVPIPAPSTAPAASPSPTPKP